MSYVKSHKTVLNHVDIGQKTFAAVAEPLEPRLLLSGTVSFLAPAATGSTPVSIATGDFNNDGKPDMATANYPADSVSVLLGNGDGTFLSNTDYSTDSRPDAVIAVDVNGDGKLDLVTSNGLGNTVSVLLGNGDGTFLPETHYSTGASPWSVVAADFNGDGKMDLATADYDDGAVAVLLGNGDGTFQASTSFLVGSSTQSVTAADINGDGKMDLVAGDFSTNMVSVLLGDGDGTFQAAADFATGLGPVSIIAVDLNGDGKLDVATADYNGSTVSALLGNGNGTFQAPASFNTGSQPYQIIALDADRDGKLDLATANSAANTLSVLLGNGNGTFQANTDLLTSDIHQSLAAADVNSDGKADLLTVNGNLDTALVLLGNGDGTFQPLLPTTQYPTGNNPNWVISADFNHDGKLDVATANYADFSVSILLGNGDGTFGAKSDFTTGDGTWPDSIVAADLNGDGNLDLVTTNAITNNVSVLLGVGDGTFQAATSFATGANPWSVVAADLNGDGVLDLATANYDSNTVSVLLGVGDGTFQDKADFATGGAPRSVVAADVDGDGKMDLITANSGDDTVSILLGNGNGTFQAETHFATGSGPRSVIAADLDGDGKLDIATANWSSNNVSVLLGNGNGTFQDKAYFAVGVNPSSVIAADLDGDGKLDLVTANWGSDSVSVLAGNGDGTFQDEIEFDAGANSSPSSAVTADVNRDGKADLIVAGYDSNSVSVLLNSTPNYKTIIQAPTNNAPVVVIDAATVNEDSSANVIPVLANDTDADGDMLAVTSVGTATNGTVSLVSGLVKYTPAANYLGADSFTYSISDGHGGTATGTVNVTVQFVGIDVSIGDGQAVKSVTYTDTDGTAVTVAITKGSVRLRLKGVGLTTGGTTAMTVYGAAELGHVNLLSTSSASSLTFTTKGGKDALAVVGEINGSSPLGTLKGAGINLAYQGIVLTDAGYIGSLTLHDILTGVGVTLPGAGAAKGISITAGDIGDGVVIDLGSPLKGLTAAQVEATMIQAPWAGTIKTTGDKKRSLPGDLKAAIILTGASPAGVAINKLNVLGTMTGASIIAPLGRVGTVSAAAWNVGTVSAKTAGSLTVKGDFHAGVNLTDKDAKGTSLSILSVGRWLTNSQIRTTGDVGTVTAGGMTDSMIYAGLKDIDTLAVTGDFNAPATIKSLTIKGIAGLAGQKMFADSVVAATTIKTAVLRDVDTTAAVNYDPFGLAADSSIGKLTIYTGKTASVKTNITASLQEPDNFRVNIV